MAHECIVLAGGLGTRLRSELPDLPKVLAPVAGHPFLTYVVRWLEKNEVTRAILSLGYQSEDVIAWGDAYDGNIDLVYSIESEPLGTGGAILEAIEKAQTKNFFVINGDTLFDADLVGMENYHQQCDSDLTLALKPMTNFDRYGLVRADENMRITGFEEKGFHEQGFINGGIYMMNRECMSSRSLPKRFSFEHDFLEIYYNEIDMYGYVQDSYFIDIGIPADFNRAQSELKRFLPDNRI